eukprot:3665722-Heterocapsa_arctica.AAC.1
MLNAHPDKTVHANKKQGTIMIDWQLVARVVPSPSDTDCAIEWNPIVVAAANINKEAVTAAFASSSSSSSDVKWEA